MIFFLEFIRIKSNIKINNNAQIKILNYYLLNFIIYIFIYLFKLKYL